MVTEVRVVLCCPAPYRIGLSGATIPLLYTLFEREGIECDLAFLDTMPASLGSKRKLKEFDIVAFTIQYEWEYVDLVKMLLASGIKPTKPREKPIIVGGGPCITSNPEPLADILDVAVIGDAEKAVPKLCEAVSEGISGIETLSGEEGFYLFLNECRKAVSSEMAEARFPTMAAKGIESTVYGRAARVEVVRGCPMLCRYCLIGWTAKPYREKPVEQVILETEQQLDILQAKKAVFIGAGLTFYSKFEEICKKTTALNLEGSMASIRPELMSREKLAAMRELGQRTLTMGVETGSDRLRAAIGRGGSSESVLAAAQEAVETGFTKIKVYLLVGLPGEREEDLAETAKLIESIRKLNVRIQASINPLIPKAHTPSQYWGFAGYREAKIRAEKLAAMLRRIGVRASPGMKPSEATIQAMLSLGGRELGRIILKAAEVGRGTGGWRRVLRARGIRIEEIKPRICIEEETPWSLIDVGVTEELVLREYHKSLDELGLGDYFHNST